MSLRREKLMAGINIVNILLSSSAETFFLKTDHGKTGIFWSRYVETMEIFGPGMLKPWKRALFF